MCEGKSEILAKSWGNCGESATLKTPLNFPQNSPETPLNLRYVGCGWVFARKYVFCAENRGKIA